MSFLTFAEAKVGSAPPFVPRNHMAHLLQIIKRQYVYATWVSINWSSFGCGKLREYLRPGDQG